MKKEIFVQVQYGDTFKQKTVMIWPEGEGNPIYIPISKEKAKQLVEMGVPHEG